MGIAFCWCLQIDVDAPFIISDLFIPELFFDYFYLQKGEMIVENPPVEIRLTAGQQLLKALHTRQLSLSFKLPLRLFGARFSLGFAESYWGKEFSAGGVEKAHWITKNVKDFSSFVSQITDTVQKNQARKTAGPLLSPPLKETAWLAQFSPRHKRRLVKKVFGINQKELAAIQNLHIFLGQACDFSAQNPRIIEHIDADVFYDQPHLNHAFKKMTGLSPLEYFEASSILQDNLMAASYNGRSPASAKIEP